MKLVEILDHTEILDWQQVGKFELSKFELDDTPYMLQIERKEIFDRNNVPEFVGKKTAEVSFSIISGKPNDADFSTSNSSSKPSLKVYGAVLNGLTEKFAGYDAFYFSAERRHSKTEKEFDSKKSIYFLAADKAKKRTGAHLYEREDSYGSYWLLSKIDLSDDSLNKIKLVNALREAMIACGFITRDQ